MSSSSLFVVSSIFVGSDRNDVPLKGVMSAPAVFSSKDSAINSLLNYAVSTVLDGDTDVIAEDINAIQGWNWSEHFEESIADCYTAAELLGDCSDLIQMLKILYVQPEAVKMAFIDAAFDYERDADDTVLSDYRIDEVEPDAT